jgi:hypothetical protein
MKSHPSAEGRATSHEPNRHEPSATSYELPFAHHNADGSVDINSLIGVAARFRFLRLRVPMTAAEIITVANHLADHFEERGMTVLPSIQVLRTSKKSIPQRRKP